MNEELDIFDPADETPEGVYDASNPEHVNAVKRDKGREAKDDLEVMKGLMAYRMGRAFVFRQLAACHLFEASWGEPTYMAFREGERNVGLRLFALLGQAAPAEYSIMMKEHSDGWY